MYQQRKVKSVDSQVKSVKATPYLVYPINKSITIDRLSGNELISVVDATGNLITKTISRDASASVAVKPGLYVVKIDAFSYKILVN